MFGRPAGPALASLVIIHFGLHLVRGHPSSSARAVVLDQLWTKTCDETLEAVEGVRRVGTAKSELQAQLDRITAIEAIAIEVKAVEYDELNDETTSTEDEAAEMQLFAKAFQAWADGKIGGTAEDIFDAVNAVLED
jgi:hypothetical protein